MVLVERRGHDQALAEVADQAARQHAGLRLGVEVVDREEAVDSDAKDRDMPLRPWVDTEYLNPGYLLRSLDRLPRSGDKPEWQHSQDYLYESKAIPAIDLDDPIFSYSY